MSSKFLSAADWCFWRFGDVSVVTWRKSALISTSTSRKWLASCADNIWANEKEGIFYCKEGGPVLWNGEVTPVFEGKMALESPRNVVKTNCMLLSNGIRLVSPIRKAPIDDFFVVFNFLQLMRQYGMVKTEWTGAKMTGKVWAVQALNEISFIKQ